MKNISFSKTYTLKEYKEKQLIIETFLFHLHFSGYYADEDPDEIVFRGINRYYAMGNNNISRFNNVLMRRGTIHFDMDSSLNLKVSWKVDFLPYLFFSFFVAIFFSSGYFYFTSPNWLHAGILFSGIFSFLLPVSYIAVRLKIAFHHNSVM
jgi:hypothetical protein